MSRVLGTSIVRTCYSCGKDFLRSPRARQIKTPKGRMAYLCPTCAEEATANA